MTTGVQVAIQRHVRDAFRQQPRDVEDAHRAVHEIADVEPVPVRGERKTLRRATDGEAEYASAAVSVDDRDHAARFECDEQVDAEPVMQGGARDAGIVMVDALRHSPRPPVWQVDARTDRADGVLEIERRARRAACRA